MKCKFVNVDSVYVFKGKNQTNAFLFAIVAIGADWIFRNPLVCRTKMYSTKQM